MDEMLADQLEREGMFQVPTGLWLKIIKQHKTRKVRDPSSFVEQYMVNCPACDVINWRTWRPGEPEYECDIWRNSRILGLLPPVGL